MTSRGASFVDATSVNCRVWPFHAIVHSLYAKLFPKLCTLVTLSNRFETPWNWGSFYRFVTIHAFDRRRDGRTDGQTDGRTEFSSLDRVCIPCSAVIIIIIIIIINWHFKDAQLTKVTSQRRLWRRRKTSLIIEQECFHRDVPLQCSVYVLGQLLYACTLTIVLYSFTRYGKP